MHEAQPVLLLRNKCKKTQKTQGCKCSCLPALLLQMCIACSCVKNHDWHTKLSLFMRQRKQ